MSTPYRAPGGLALLTAEPRDANGHLVTNPQVAWTSRSPSVASVDPGGLVTAAGNGTAVIRATVDGTVEEMPIVVRQRVVEIAMGQELVRLAVADQVTLLPTAVDANRFEVPDAQLTWRSANPEVAQVSTQGTVTALASGSTRIVAEADGALAVVAITVQ